MVRRPVNTGKFGVLLAAACTLAVLAPRSHAQGSVPAAPLEPRFSLDTEAVGPQRFIAAHGRRAVIDGYATQGLDVWVYPFQILSDYRVDFRPAGATTAISGADILSRVIYSPDCVTRVYLGPDFIVREKIFVPLNEPGGIITYSVEGPRQVDIEVHAMPVLNLMWPGAVGGQGLGWNPSLSAYVLSEQDHGFTAVVGSPDIVAHDDADNRAFHDAAESGVGFTVRAGASGTARVLLALNPPHASDNGLLFQKLAREVDALQSEFAAHDREVEKTLLQVETPDQRVNQAIAWAQFALDQAWACNPDLGCGYVAGYGPDRGARRPQYDWFFAGDGLTTADAAIAEGDREHARDELTFIFRYQDKKTGMIWHELAQSVSLIDWANKYPYMFVHVDITFQFLGTVARYVNSTGDIAFARENWPAIEAAYRYCLSVIDPETGLPRIPSDKEGGNEQDRMADDLGLSSSWVSAASSFAQLAQLTGHTESSDQPLRAADRARAAIPLRYWSSANSFWISGHNVKGEPMTERRSGPPEALTQQLFGEPQTDSLLDQIASANFQTDWGSRGIGEGSDAFNPESYAQGSVWPVHTAALAEAFWMNDRPVTALALWRSLLPSSQLGSLGHMPEVLSGSFYRPQIESVPEQTWSSAGFLEATVHGLLGLSVDSSTRRVRFAPQLPAQWNDVSISRIRLSEASLSFALHRDPDGLSLKIMNPAEPFQLEFDPDLPLGAALRSTELNGHAVEGVLENHPQQTNARVEVTIPQGESLLHLGFVGGVSVISDQPEPRPGDRSVGVRIIDVQLKANTITIVADVPGDRASHVSLKTAWKVASAQGVTAEAGDDGLLDLTFAPASKGSLSYRRVQATIELKP